jgi:lipopolysaccharide transport system permease protein
VGADRPGAGPFHLTMTARPPRPRPAAAAPGGDEVLIDRAQDRDSFARTLAAMYQYRQLLRTLVAKDLKLKYRGSILGFVWSLLNPLLTIAVYTIAFTYILKMEIPGFVFYLMLGILAWTFFVNSAMMAAGAIVDNGGLVKSVFFPRAILPVASVLFNFAQYLLSALVFLPLLLIIYRVPPSPPMLLYPVFLVLQLLFTMGIALIVATATAFFRDVRHFLEIGLTALFWVTPIVYQLDKVSPALQTAILMGPMAPYIVAYHDIFFYRTWPAAQVWALAVAYPVVTLGVGAMLMLQHEDKFSEQI